MPEEDLYFSADLHFFHHTASELRGFSDKLLMNEVLVTNWNATVPASATVILLGDISFGNTSDTVEILNRLNGTLILVRGNHDKNIKAKAAERFSEIYDYLEVDVVAEDMSKQRIVMLHYAMRVWNKSHYGAWHLYGHSHGSLRGVGKSMDVGVDANFLSPVAFSEVKRRLDMKPIHVVDHHQP